MSQKRTQDGRYTFGTKGAPDAQLISLATVNDPVPANRAVAVMDPQCSYEDLEHAARNDRDRTVRLTAVAFAPEAGLQDRNPFVRALAQELSGSSYDQETSRALELIAA